jgi:hypothetical protein
MRKEPSLIRGQEVNTESIFLLFSRGGHFKMKAIERLSVIRHLSEKNKDWKHTELFRVLGKEDI